MVSDAAILAFNPPPVAPGITAHPSNLRVFAPAVVTFTANCTGTSLKQFRIVATNVAGVATTFASQAGVRGALKDNVHFFPTAVAFYASGTIHVSDTFNDVIRKITAGGVVTTVLGQLRPDPWFEFQTGPDARLGGPVYVAIPDATQRLVAQRTGEEAVHIAPVP